MNLLYVAIQLYMLVVFARLILSWIPISPSSSFAPVAHAIYVVTEPPLAAIRSAVPAIRTGAGAIDLSAAILLLGLWLLATLVGHWA